MSPVFRICYNFRIVGGQRLSRGRDVGGAVPYKRDRIVFVLSYNGCNCGLVSSTGERCSPLQVCSRKIVGLAVFLFNLVTVFEHPPAFDSGFCFVCNNEMEFENV